MELMKLKYFRGLSPASIDNDEYPENQIVDTQGLSEILWLIETGELGADIGSEGDSNPLQIEESDSPDGAFADIEGAAFTSPIPSSAGNQKYGIFIDLRKTHKRYQRVKEPTAGDGSMSESYLSIVAIGVPDIGPVSAEEMGLVELVTA